MEILRGLKEIVELEIFVTPEREAHEPYDISRVGLSAIEILQASECHKNCPCNHECGCAEKNECSSCNPPKRFLRIKTCPRGYKEHDSLFIIAGTCLEEIEVSPRQVWSKK